MLFHQDGTRPAYKKRIERTRQAKMSGSAIRVIPSVRYGCGSGPPNILTENRFVIAGSEASASYCYDTIHVRALSVEIRNCVCMCRCCQSKTITSHTFLGTHSNCFCDDTQKKYLAPDFLFIPRLTSACLIFFSILSSDGNYAVQSK